MVALILFFMGCEGDQTNSEPKVSTIISYTEKAEQLNRVRPDVHAAAFHVFSLPDQSVRPIGRTNSFYSNIVFCPQYGHALRCRTPKPSEKMSQGEFFRFDTNGKK